MLEIETFGVSVRPGQVWTSKDPNGVWEGASLAHNERYQVVAIIDCLKASEDLLLTLLLTDGKVNRVRWRKLFFLSHYTRIC